MLIAYISGLLCHQNMIYRKSPPLFIRCLTTSRKFFIRSFFLTLTIGLPFCIFKGIFGIAAMPRDTIQPPSGRFWGDGRCMAGVDFAMNTVRAAGDLLDILRHWNTARLPSSDVFSTARWSSRSGYLALFFDYLRCALVGLDHAIETSRIIPV